MKRRLCFAVLFGWAIGFAGSARARINMLEPWSPGQDFVIPDQSWNHDVHLGLGVGKRNTDFFEVGYLLTTPVSPDWEVGGGLNFITLDRPGGNESGLSDLSLGAQYKAPRGLLPPALELVGEAGITLPTGDPDKGLGAGGLGMFLGGSFQGAMDNNVTGYAHLGTRLFLKGQETDLGEVFEYAFGMKYLIDGQWIATADVRGFNHGADKHHGVKFKRYQEIYLAPGAYFRPDKSPVEYLGNLLLGLTGDSYDFGLQISAKF